MLGVTWDEAMDLTRNPSKWRNGAGVSLNCLFTSQLSPVPIYTAW